VAFAGEPVEQKAEKAALTAQAGALYDQGSAAYKDQKWPEARAAFLAAWALEKHWQIAANLADTELQMGRYREAAEHASFYRAQSPEDRHARADALIAKTKVHVVTLHVETDPLGADVWIDGQSAGRTPLPEAMFLEPGKHSISARMSGRLEAISSIDKASGADDVVKLKLLLAATVPPPVEPKNKILLIGGGVGFLALLGVGAGLSAGAADKAGQADKLLASVVTRGGSNACSKPGPALRGDCATLQGLNNDSDTFQNTGVAMFIAGGVVAAGTLAYWLWPSEKPKVSAAVTPLAGGGGVTVRGEF